MGGLFGVASHDNCTYDVFFGTDYHSHLGTRRGGMCFYGESGFQRSIHNIENSPFRTKFERDMAEFEGNMGIGCISDMEPQPVLICAKWGSFAVTTVGIINNMADLTDEILQHGGHFFELSGGRVNPTELAAALIAQKENIVEGIRYAQQRIEGSMTILAMTSEAIYAARDRLGRTPMLIGHKEGAFCASFENFVYYNLGYTDYSELGPGEIVRITADRVESLAPPLEKCRICAFLWTYYGYPNSTYEGVNVEEMRYRCGAILADNDAGDACAGDADCIAGVPDSGTAHAIGYANRSGLPFSRPLIKYTPTWPRSFMPQDQGMRDRIARMKLVPVDSLIRGRHLLLIDDSIVRGTQIRSTIRYLYDHGARSVHIRSACPPIVYGCKYLNFSRSNAITELIARRVIKEREGTEFPPLEVLDRYADPVSDDYQAMLDRMAEMLGVDSVRFQTLDGLVRSIGIDPDRLCTYCWSGRE